MDPYIRIRRLLTAALSIVLVLGMMPAAVTAQAYPDGISVGGGVAAFNELPDELRWQNTSVPELPDTLSGILEGKQASIPVIWQADRTYDANFSAQGLYVFTAVPDGSFGMAAGVEAPRITVYIPPNAGGMAARIVGSGTEASPVEITTAAQLAEVAVLVNAGRLETFLLNDLAATVSLKLANDIDLSGYATGEGWLPIGTSAQPFKSIFDGDGHIIAGLTINRPGGTDQGLFGQIGVSGIVQNLGVVQAHINVQNGISSFAGILAGQVHGRVQNCYTTGSVLGDSYVGGMAGGVRGTISNGYSTASVRGKDDVGGLAGALLPGSIMENGYAAGSVSGITASSKIGGIAGSMDGGTLRNSAALNLGITGNTAIGRVLGQASGGYTLFGNAAFNGIPGIWSNPGANSVDGESKPAAEISAAGFFETWFAHDPAWTYESGKLPGLFGTAVNMPAHIVDKGGAEFVGDGTVGVPYQIRTAAELARLAELVNAGTVPYANANKYYKLMDDLDLSGYAAGTGWTPIGTDARPFKGKFDGGSHIIAGLVINRPNSDDQGLFGAVGSGGNVQNLGVTNVNIVGKRYVGGVAGNVVGNVQNCYVTGSVKGVNTIGGIAGYVDETATAPNGTVQNCYVSASVSGTGNYIGGIAGYVDGTVKNSYAFGSVNGNSDIGGVTGHTTDLGTLRNCYAANSVSGIFSVGGLAGSIYGTLRNCAALNISVNGSMDVGRVTGDSMGGDLDDNAAFIGIPGTWNDDYSDGFDGESRTAADIGVAGFFEALFGNAPAWTYENGKLPGLFGTAIEMPVHLVDKDGAEFVGDGTVGAPYQIRTAEELARLAELVNAGTAPYADAGKTYKLMNDLNLSGYANGSGWMPIGTNVAPFKGNFDGGGKVVTGLVINRSSSDFQGLFGMISSAAVYDLGVADANIVGGSYTGGIAGQISGSTVQSCFVTGQISGADRVGGFAGYVDSGKVRNCYSTANVSGADDVGGLIGEAQGASTLQNSYATGQISGSTYVGGVVGNLGHQTMLKICAALNAGVSAAVSAGGRIAGSREAGAVLSGNAAFSGISGGWSNTGADELDGADIALPQINAASFWTTASNWDGSGWDESVWTIDDGKLPVLRNVGGAQSGEGGLHLIIRDIAHASVQITGNYTYTGSPIQPALTVAFDGNTLIKGLDYTLSDAHNTDAGSSATVTMNGIGNFAGTREIVFAIHKAAGPSAPTDVTGSSAVSGSTYTYTVDPIPGAEYRMDNDAWQTGNTFAGIAPGSSHTFYARIKETANYNAGAAGESGAVVFAKLDGRPAPSLDYTVSESDFPKTVTIAPVAGAEYRFDNGGYSAVNTYISSSAEDVTLYIRLAETVTYNASDFASAFVSTANRNQSAPSAFALTYERVNDESYTVTIPATSGAEYSFDGIAWGGGNKKSGLAFGATVTGYKRMAARPGYNASPAASDSLTLPLLQVQTPTASPGGGSFSGSQQVTLSSATPGADIYYTTDGTTPTPGSLLYTAPIQLTATVTLRAIAVKTGMSDSGVLSATFTKNSSSGGGGGSAPSVNEPTMNKPVIDRNGTSMDPTGIDPTKPSVTLEVEPKNGTAYVGIPASILASFESENAAFMIEIKTPYGSYRIPVKLASLIPNLKELLAKSNLKAEDVSFKITLTDKSGDKALQAALGNGLPKGKVMGAMVDYHLEIVNTQTGQTIGTTNPFSKALTRLIPMPRNVAAMPKQWGAFRYNDNAKEFEFVPAKAVKLDGVWYAMISSYSNSAYAVAENSVSFADVQKHWAKSDVELAAAKGLVEGVGGGRYDPGKAVTRAEFTVMLVRALGRGTSTAGNAPYGDVKAGVWYSNAVAAAKELGLLGFMSGSSFKPNQALTREEMASMLAAAIRLEQPTVASSEVSLDAYKDIGSVVESDLENIRLMSKLQIMTGTSQNAFDPKGVTTRAQAATVFVRTLQVLGLIDSFD